jgi:general secretion pathway protein C
MRISFMWLEAVGANRIHDNRRMVSNSQNKWIVRGTTMLLWALLAASAAYWMLKLTTSSAAGPAAVPASRVAPPVDPSTVARLLGFTQQAAAAAPVISLASRFTLVGVVAGRSRGGAALIAVDGKPARPFRVGYPVDEGVWLQAVEGRRAVLAAGAGGPPLLTLELPPIRR